MQEQVLPSVMSAMRSRAPKKSLKQGFVPGFYFSPLLFPPAPPFSLSRRPTAQLSEQQAKRREREREKKKYAAHLR